MAIDSIYDKYGFDADGYDKNGFDREGFDIDGFNSHGYDRYGFNRRGFDVDGFDRQGYSNDGYNRDGVDRNGKAMPGITHNSVCSSTKKAIRQQVSEGHETVNAQNRFIHVVSDADFQYLAALPNQKVKNVILNTQFGQMYGFEVTSNRILITSMSEVYKHPNHQIIMTSNGFEKAIVERHYDSRFKIYRETQNPKKFNAFMDSISQRISNNLSESSTYNEAPAAQQDSVVYLSKLSKSQRIILYNDACHCYECEQKSIASILHNHDAIIRTYRQGSYHINVMRCDTCGIYFMRYSDYLVDGGIELHCNIDKSHLTGRSHNTITPVSKKNWDSKTNLSNLKESQKIMLYSQKCHCYKCAKKFSQDTIVDCTAYVSTKQDTVVPVTVQYCSGCSTFFMNYEVFENYNRKYGGLKFNCELDRSYISRSSSLNFADDSFLSRAGYSVNASVSKGKRQAVLADLLESGRSTKWEITEKLSEFIKLRNGNPNMLNAIARWEEDIAFVADYNSKSQIEMGFATFEQGKKKPR